MRALRKMVAFVAVLLLMHTGCSNNSHRLETERERTSTFVMDQDVSYISEDYPSDLSSEENLVDFSDITQLDYVLRADLGYPRIHRIINSYEETIRRYSEQYGFDWRLILAVMNQESRFRIQAVSHRGAFGLMQIMPTTGQDVSHALGLDGVYQPEDNIAGGVYYLWRMRTMFDPGNGRENYSDVSDEDVLRIALAAYNGGPTRVRDAQRLATFLGLNPYRWDVIRDVLPMLERSYYTLHQYVWENGRPTGGYFYGWPETLNYVESVMGYYYYYQMMFE